MFSDCSGECDDCYVHYVGGCLAGHGDDHFYKITKMEAKFILKNGWVKSEILIQQLKEKFNL